MTIQESVSYIEKRVDKRLKKDVTITIEQRKNAYNRGYKGYYNGLRCVYNDEEYMNSLFVMSTANVLALSKEWNEGFITAMMESKI